MSDESNSVPRVNRRLTARHACHIQVSYCTSDEWRPATAMDISHKGCRLRLGEELPRGKSVQLRFTHAGADGQPVAAGVAGTVIWTRLEGLSYQAGVHFPTESPDLEAILATLR